MKFLYKLPKEGHFVAVWENKNKMWSSVYKWDSGNLLIYVASNSSCGDYWKEVNDEIEFLESRDVTYFSK